MKIVIEIDDARFKDIRRIACVQLENYHFKTVEQIIANATPLPKGHGKLKDANKIEALLDLDKADNEIAKALKNIIESVPTIVEADKESEELK